MSSDFPFNPTTQGGMWGPAAAGRHSLELVALLSTCLAVLTGLFTAAWGQPGWAEGGGASEASRLCIHSEGQEVRTGAEEPGVGFGLRTFFLHSQTWFYVPFERKWRIAVLSPAGPAPFNLVAAAISNYNLRGLL